MLGLGDSEVKDKVSTLEWGQTNNRGPMGEGVDPETLEAGKPGGASWRRCRELSPLCTFEERWLGETFRGVASLCPKAQSTG